MVQNRRLFLETSDHKKASASRESKFNIGEGIPIPTVCTQKQEIHLFPVFPPPRLNHTLHIYIHTMISYLRARVIYSYYFKLLSSRDHTSLCSSTLINTFDPIYNLYDQALFMRSTSYVPFGGG